MASPQLFDRKGRRQRWLRARIAEESYSRKLRQLARNVRSIFLGLEPDGTMASTQPLIRVLTRYADIIEPWATSVAKYMLADVNRRNEAAWKEHGRDIGRELGRVVRDTPVGAVYRGLLAEQVTLIQSIPLDAAERAQAMVQKGMLAGTRSTTIAKEILKQADIPLWRAKLIARTEVSKSSVALTQARAMAIGSVGYIWRTVGDADVRPEHKEMEGEYVRWDKPPSFKSEPTLGAYHAGCGPNCRCYPDPVLPDF